MKSIDYNQFLALNLPEPEFILNPVIPAQGFLMVHAYRGVGKTHVSLGIAHAVATGGELFGWSAKHPSKVLFVDGEMAAYDLRQRLSWFGQRPREGFFRIITPDLQDGQSPGLSTDEGRAQLEAQLGDAKLIVLDNLSTLFNFRDENSGEEWARIQPWLLSLRRRGFAVLLVHHSGKGGKQRGTSKREDVLNNVIHLSPPPDYKQSMGCVMDVSLEKGRMLFGDNAGTFRASLRVENGLAVWDIKSAEELAEETKERRQKEQGENVNALAKALAEALRG